MDTNRFGDLLKGMSGSATRRTFYQLLAGGALGSVAGRFGAVEAEARRKKKRGNNGRCGGSHPVRCSPTAADPREFCFPRGAVCCGAENGGGACPPGADCCPPTVLFPLGTCAPGGSHCCPPESGGHCPDYAPVCCPPTLQDPLGLCVASGYKCCTSQQGGGSCAIDETCCPPSAGFPNGTCAPPGVVCPPRTGGPLAQHQYRPRLTSADRAVEKQQPARPRLATD